jgi:predicted dehydrogenase
MNKLNRILIIGAGNRVVNDVIPALGAIDFDLSKIIIVRKKAKQINKYPIITVFDNLKTVMEEFEPELIICCVPPDELPSILSILIKFEFIHLLVDTPIFPNLEKLRLVSKTVSVKGVY